MGSLDPGAKATVPQSIFRSASGRLSQATWTKLGLGIATASEFIQQSKTGLHDLKAYIFHFSSSTYLPFT